MNNCPACAERKMKANARAATRAAIKDGRLVRQRCADCVAKGVQNDWPVQAHHEDYSKPLEIVWLCNNHHHARHARYSGGK
jgi:hypothetical protein